MYRKVYEVTGYTADADTWCIDCTIDRYGEPEYGPTCAATIDREGNEVSPIFLGSEWGYQPFCSSCHAGIDVTVINEQTGEKWD